MKIQIIYTSLTGCTEKIANAIFNGIDEENKSIHNIKDGIPETDGDIILLGYWGVGGGPCDEMKKVLEKVKNKAVGVFCTLGYYADSQHGFDTVQTGVDILKENNKIIGTYVCNGAVASHLMKGQGKEQGKMPTEQKELRWEMIKNHPTEAECALAAERFNERIRLYKRSIELNIEFNSVI